MSVDRQLLSVAEAAQVMGVSRSLLYALLAHEEIPSLKIGRARRIPLSALEAFIAERLHQTRSSEEAPR